MDPEPGTRPYEGLSPELMLDAVERFGVRCDGTLLGLNSYENRVYQVGVEDESPLVVKFYRPGRWSDEAIREEHRFALELVEHDVPMVAPMADGSGETLLEQGGFRFAVYPRRGGYWPELADPARRSWMGRFVARIHAVGETRDFEHRPALDVATYGDESLRYLLENDVLPPGQRESYRAAAEQVLQMVRAAFENAGGWRPIRMHGDFHKGNVLWTDTGPHFVDLDDCRTGPAVQDLWMLLSGSRDEREAQLGDLLRGYSDFRLFDARELHLVEALRSLRLIHYATWLARRWDDPAFPRAFPWFGTPIYWEEQVANLREQSSQLAEPPLRWH